MRVKVSEIDNFQATTPQAGLKLYTLIEPALAGGEPVELDFDGVRHFSTAFFGSSIGILVEADIENRLPALLHYENLPPLGQTALHLATEYATRRRENPRWGTALDESMRKSFERE